MLSSLCWLLHHHNTTVTEFQRASVCLKPDGLTPFILLNVSTDGKTKRRSGDEALVMRSNSNDGRKNFRMVYG